MPRYTARAVRVLAFIVVACAIVGVRDARSQSVWMHVAGMATARYGHVAVRLLDGRVLVAGGYDGSYLNSAEIFDPRTNSWRPAGQMAAARYRATATLLSDGRVLVAGGSNATTNHSSVDVFDPATNLWTTGPSMRVARSYHTATVLNDGRILITGGYTNGTTFGAYTASSETYNPSTQTWTQLGNMRVAKVGHTAALLPDGRVIIAGGANYAQYEFTSDIFSPTSNTWSAGPNLCCTQRYSHVGTVLPDGRPLIAAGYYFSGYLASAEVYEATSNRWTAVSAMPTARNDLAAVTLPDGRWMAIGGYRPNPTNAVEVFNPTLMQWTAITGMNSARATLTATRLSDGRVLVVGGNSGSGGALRTAEVWGTPSPASVLVEPAVVISGSPVDLVATLASQGEPLPNRTLTFAVLGQNVGTAVTDGSGRAVLHDVPTAGRAPGSYPAGISVSWQGDAFAAAANGSGSLTVLTPAPVVTWATPTAISYPKPLSAAELNASADAEGTFVYDPPAGTVLGAGVHTLTATFTPADTAHDPVVTAVPLTVLRAAPSVSVTNQMLVYDGTAHDASASVLGAFGEPLGPVLLQYRLIDAAGGPIGEWTEVTPMNAGTYAVRALYAGSANYEPAMGSGELIIERASPTVTVTGGAFVYDALPHPAVAFVTGVGGEDLGAATVQYGSETAAPVNAGTYVAVADFAGSANYQAAHGSAEVVVEPAAPVLAVTGGEFRYDGLAHQAIATATGVLGEDLGSISIQYATGQVPRDAGTHVATALFTGTSNYTRVSRTASVVITPVAPTVTVSGGTFGYDGLPHAATATVTGVNGEDLGAASLSYNGHSSVPRDVGSYAVSAAYAGSRNYIAGSASTLLIIEPGAPTISVSAAIIVYDGLAHTATGAAVGVEGESLQPVTLTYNGSASAPVAAGIYDVVAHFPGGGNYVSGSATTQLRIVPAPLTVAAVDASKTYGQPNPSFEVRYVGFVGTDGPASLGGVLAFDTSAVDASPTGTYRVDPRGLVSSNYVLDFVPALLTVVQASSQVTLTPSSNPAGYLQPIALRANVTPAPPGAGIATGTVEFLDAGVLIGSATVVEGAGTINVVLGPGTHAITARYLGDVNVAGGVAALSQVVNPRSGSSTTSVRMRPATSTVGDAVTFDVDVSSPVGSVSGVVELRDGATALALVALSNGRGSFVTTSLSVGSHTIVAAYPGTADIPPSVSSPVVHTVMSGTPLERTTMRLSPRRTAAGAPIPVDVILTGTGSAPTGNVALYVDGGMVAVLPLTATSATGAFAETELAPLSIGTHVLTAVYTGSTAHAGTTAEVQLRVAR